MRQQRRRVGEEELAEARRQQQLLLLCLPHWKRRPCRGAAIGAARERRGDAVWCRMRRWSDGKP